MDQKPVATRGRAALSNREGRFAERRRVAADDGWESLAAPSERVLQSARPEQARTIIARNSSPDVPFGQSINPYRGCEHGCIYCYARPSHAYLDLSPGLDFERHIVFKPGAAELLCKELDSPSYRCEPITLGANTDPYQPLEAEKGLSRAILAVCEERGQPVTIITKSALVLRDADILARMAERRLCNVFVSITTLDDELKRRLEPRTANGSARLRVVAGLAARGIPVGVLAAPLIPALNEAELETILHAAAGAGARKAGWILLRLPHEVRELFREWLEHHYPERADHVMSLIRQSREGRENDPRFGHRMRGSGPFAALIARRFQIAARRLGLDGAAWPALDCSAFRPAAATGAGSQLQLF